MNFLKTLLASTLGVLLALVIIFIVAFIFISIAISSAGETQPYVGSNTVLKIDISGALPTRSATNPFDQLLNKSRNNNASLRRLSNNLHKAASDDNIKGVLLEINSVNESWANLQAAYRTISKFKDRSRKFIYATTNDAGFNEKGYYLAAAADSVFAPPESFFEFDGFYTQVTFLKGLFDKLDLKVDIARHGKYKGAVEPYFRKKLSEANKYQLQQLLKGDSDTFLAAVSHKTGKSVDALNATLNRAPHLTAEFGYKNGFIDSLLYANQLDSLINKRMNLHGDASHRSIAGNRYAKVKGSSPADSVSIDGDIGVIYASGVIMSGTAQENPFSPNTNITAPWFKDQLKKAMDDDVQALVIRLNSPGGSGSASDAIWNMIRQSRKKIPVIVSMGPVAASGGYYIAMAADSIVAEPTTITGSIGVFATHFNARKVFNNKLGITFDEVKTNKHANWLSPLHSFTASEKKAFQANITQFYHTFIAKVAHARGLSKKKVAGLAQGRVWSGADAKKHHLVDVLGGLDKAKQIAAAKAGLHHWGTETYPKPKDLFRLLMNATGDKIQAMIGPSFLRSDKLQNLNRRLSLMEKHGAMLLFPYHINVQ